MHIRIYLTMPSARGNNPDMPVLAKALPRHGVLGDWMILAAQANVAMVKETPLVKTRLQVW
ncbi:hypothetical protein D3C71_1772540 [compost metagenome]